jgi:hypothetical protein
MEIGAAVASTILHAVRRRSLSCGSSSSCINNNNNNQSESMELDFQPASTNVMNSSRTINVEKIFSMFMYLPYELKFHICRFVSFKDLCNLQMSCKLLHTLATENALWKDITCKHFDLDPESLIDFGRDIKDWKNNFKVQYGLYKKGSVICEKVTNSISKPNPRFAQTGVTVGEKIYYIGGQMTEGRSDDIFSYDSKNSTFEKIKIMNYDPDRKLDADKMDISDDCKNFMGVDGKVPSFARHQSVLINGKIYVFGGYDYTYFYNLAVFDPERRTWTYPVVKGDLPAPRSNHSSAVVGHKFYIFGGSVGDNVDRYTVTNDFYCFDTKTMTWTKIVTMEEPSKRVGHVMTSIGSYIYLFGGGVWGKLTGWTHQYNDMYIFDTKACKWEMVTVKAEEKPQVCTYPYIFNVGHNVLLFGGAALMGSTVTNKLYSFDVLRKKWTELPFEGEISSRSIGSANLIGNEVYLWGGYCGGILPEDNDFFKFRINLNNELLVLKGSS